ncbi:MAG TPA: phosphoribosyltransferase family protein [Candidatus Limnocylindria bacterium]|nr:phosphoribosyltransferase family protein [Candidatus Limnocylindria bacterium]
MGALSDLVLPRRCSGCRAPGEWLCLECRDACEPEPLALGRALAGRAAGTFAGPLREAIHALKYGGEHALAIELGALVAAEVARDLARGAVLDAVVVVPLHRARLRERGYDQAHLLAAAVARSCGLPLLPALRRIRRSVPQVELDRARRAESVRGAFVGVAGSLRGLRVALVDDVTTTGATLRSAAAAARACGARSVRAYTVASDL